MWGLLTRETIQHPHVVLEWWADSSASHHLQGAPLASN